MTQAPEEFTPAEKTWLRQQREPARAYRAFRTYLDMGAARSLSGASAKLAGGPERAPNEPRREPGGRLKQWCRDWDWVERASAFDRHQEQIRAEAAERAERERAAEWVRRRGEHVENDWADAQDIRRQARLLLALPVVTTRLVDGGKTTVIEPATAATLRAASASIKDASEIEARAIEAAVATAPPPPPDVPADAILRAAQARLLTFHSEAEAAIAAIPSEPPDDVTD